MLVVSDVTLFFCIAEILVTRWKVVTKRTVSRESVDTHYTRYRIFSIIIMPKEKKTVIFVKKFNNSLFHR